MLRLIAIRPLRGCYEYIRKCLKEGAFYYFCDCYCISDEGVITRNQESKPLPKHIFSVNGCHTTINLSAIVGWQMAGGQVSGMRNCQSHCFN